MLDCHSIGNGILQKGLKQSVVYVVELERDLLTNFFQESTINNQTSLNFLNSDQFTQAGISFIFFSMNLWCSVQATEYMYQPMEDLQIEFQNAFILFVSDSITTERIKFAVFIVVGALMFFFVWMPYLRNLSQKIWRTKGMLNMIPMNIISRNQDLKDAFMSNELLQAVK